MFTFFKKRAQRRQLANKLYTSLVQQARLPYFYTQKGVPDSFNGRFEMVLLHSYLVWARLLKEGQQGEILSQSLFDVMFTEMNQAVRNIGVGDLGVPHHIKRMMKAYKGRSLAYLKAIMAQDDAALADSLRRNLYGTVTDVSAAQIEFFAAYIKQAHIVLEAQPSDAIMAGVIDFSGLNIPEGGTHEVDTRVVA